MSVLALTIVNLAWAGVGVAFSLWRDARRNRKPRAKTKSRPRRA